MVGHGFSRFQGSRYVDEPLVAAAPETEALVAQVLTEASVDQHVDILQQKALARVFEQLFEGISGVTPDVLVAFSLMARASSAKPSGWNMGSPPLKVTSAKGSSSTFPEFLQ